MSGDVGANTSDTSTQAATSDATIAGTSAPATHASHAIIQPLASSPTVVVSAVPTPPEVITTTEPDVTAKTATDSEPEAPKTTTSGSDATLGTKDIQSEAEMASEEEAEAKRQAELQTLIDNRTYYLPINTLETRRTKQFVLVGMLLGLILIVAWADIALDAGLVHVGNLKAVTHFFN